MCSSVGLGQMGDEDGDGEQEEWPEEGAEGAEEYEDWMCGMTDEAATEASDEEEKSDGWQEQPRRKASRGGGSRCSCAGLLA